MSLLKHLKWPLRILFTALVLLVSYFVVGYFNQKQVTIDINGNMQKVRTDAETVEDVLREADVLIEPADVVDPPLDTTIEHDMTINVTKATHIVMEVDGNIQRIYTLSNDPLQILESEAIDLHDYDKLYVNYQPVDPRNMPFFNAPPAHLRITHARQFSLYENDKLLMSGATTASTVGQLIDLHNVSLFLADNIDPTPDTPVTNNLEIRITRSSPVTIVVDGREIQTRVIADTVGEALNTLNFPLTGQDYAIPDETVNFVPDMKISVIRVIEQIDIQEDGIPYETLSLPDPSLTVGEEIRIQTGVDGVQETRILTRRENGQIVSQVIEETRILVDPIPEIITYGTQR